MQRNTKPDDPSWQLVDEIHHRGSSNGTEIDATMTCPDVLHCRASNDVVGRFLSRVAEAASARAVLETRAQRPSVAETA